MINFGPKQDGKLCDECDGKDGKHYLDCSIWDRTPKITIKPLRYTQADLDRAVAEAVQAEREAIMQILEARRSRHGTGCDCKSFDTLGAMLEEIGARGVK